MKNFFLRIESWLLITPIILLLIEIVFLGHATFDFHVHDTYFVIANSYAAVMLLFWVLVPYLCHFLLRVQKKRNKKILVIHAVVTILLIVCFFFYVRLNHFIPRRNYDYSSWESYNTFEALDKWVAVAILVFGLIQLLFLLYTIARLIVRNKN